MSGTTRRSGSQGTTGSTSTSNAPEGTAPSVLAGLTFVADGERIKRERAPGAGRQADPLPAELVDFLNKMAKAGKGRLDGLTFTEGEWPTVTKKMNAVLAPSKFKTSFTVTKAATKTDKKVTKSLTLKKVSEEATEAAAR